MKYLMEFSSCDSSYVVIPNSLDFESEHDIMESYSEVRKEAMDILKKRGFKEFKIVNIKKI